MERQVANNLVLSEDTRLGLRLFSFMRRTGVPLDSAGSRFIFEAIRLCLNDENYLDSITKNLYYKLAKNFETTPACIEKNMRIAIERGWEHGMEDFFEGHGLYLKKRPGNATFLRLLVMIIKLT